MRVLTKEIFRKTFQADGVSGAEALRETYLATSRNSKWAKVVGKGGQNQYQKKMRLTGKQKAEYGVFTDKWKNFDFYEIKWEVFVRY